jgi:hypothetical protein
MNCKAMTCLIVVNELPGISRTMVEIAIVGYVCCMALNQHEPAIERMLWVKISSGLIEKQER